MKSDSLQLIINIWTVGCIFNQLSWTNIWLFSIYHKCHWASRSPAD